MNILSHCILVLMFFLAPVPLLAQEVSSAGIPKDLIWFSKSPFYAGDTVNVYTIVYNSTPYQFTGIMELHDGNRVLGKQGFIVGPFGTSATVAIPWRVTVGNHDLSMTVANGVFTFDGKVVSHVGTIDVQSGKVELFTEMPPATVMSVSSTTTQMSSNQTSASTSIISSIAFPITERIPEPIVSAAIPVLGHLEQFRVAQANRAARAIQSYEEAIVGAVGTRAEDTSTSTGIRLDKWGGVVDDRINGTSTVKTRAQMKGWDLILHGTSGADIVRTPFQYLKLFFTLIFSFIINHVFIFYLVLLLLVYKIIRLVLGIFF